jgi:stage V sporulation protein AD
LTSAPAACDTIKRFFIDTGTAPSDYDLIVTGDLGSVGHGIVNDLLRKEGFIMGQNFKDCGMLIFDADKQDVHAGGSGCGCSAVTLCGYILNEMRSGNLNKVLFAGTGALMSPVTTQQGESIPSICHAVGLSTVR